MSSDDICNCCDCVIIDDWFNLIDSYKVCVAILLKDSFGGDFSCFFMLKQWYGVDGARDIDFCRVLIDESLETISVNGGYCHEWKIGRRCGRSKRLADGGSSELETGGDFFLNELTMSLKSDKYCKKRGRSEVRDDSHLRLVLNLSRIVRMRVKGRGVFKTSLSVIFLKSEAWAGNLFMTDVKMLPHDFAVEREGNIFLRVVNHFCLKCPLRSHMLLAFMQNPAIFVACVNSSAGEVMVPSTVNSA